MGALTNFGNQLLNGVLVQMPPGNNKAVCRFQNTNDVTVPVSKVWLYWGTTTATKVKAVIYSDSGATPGVLMSVSAEHVGHANGWVAFDISPPQPVAPGQYVWAGLIANDTDFGNNCTGGGQIYYNANLYTDGPSASFGAASVAGYTYPIVLEGDDGQLRFGRSSVDAGVGNYQPDREHGEKFVLGGTDTVYVESISTRILTTNATVKSKAAIFSDVGGFPADKIAQTVEVTGSTANSWLTLPFAEPVSLVPGTYWLCFIASENLQTPTISRISTVSLRASDGGDTEASAFSTPSTLMGVGAIEFTDMGIDIYATYSLTGPEPPPPSGHGWKPRPWQRGSIRGQSFKRPS